VERVGIFQYIVFLQKSQEINCTKYKFIFVRFSQKNCRWKKAVILLDFYGKKEKRRKKIAAGDEEFYYFYGRPQVAPTRVSAYSGVFRCSSISRAAVEARGRPRAATRRPYDHRGEETAEDKKSRFLSTTGERGSPQRTRIPYPKVYR
jgi:hypothetical protein